jgi:hypothetical protein
VVEVAAQLVILVLGVTVAVEAVLKEESPGLRVVVAEVVVVRTMVEAAALGF